MKLISTLLLLVALGGCSNSGNYVMTRDQQVAAYKYCLSQNTSPEVISASSLGLVMDVVCYPGPVAPQTAVSGTAYTCEACTGGPCVQTRCKP